MRIFLTGIAGFIGSHLAERLLARGDEIVALDCFDETLYPKHLHEQNLKLLEPHPRLRFVHGDLLDAPLVEKLIGEQQPEVVVHLAALAGVRPSIAQPKRYQRVNIEGTLNILEACRLSGVRRHVFASSSSVYGARSDVPFREEDAADRPASPYAATKRAGELLCSNYTDLHGIGTIALRFFTVYGPRQRPEMAIHKFARLIHGGQPVPQFGDGSTARDYTYIDDIIDGVVASIDRSRPGAYRVYNLGGQRVTTLANLVQMIADGLDQRAIIEALPLQPGDVPITYADGARARAELDYAPKVPIEEGIRRFCAWFTKNSA
jgi:UDP-glucuronate 4-epimerase